MSQAVGKSGISSFHAVPPGLAAELDFYAQIEHPGSIQTKSVQANLARNNLYPSARVNGVPDTMLDFSIAIAGDPDLAQTAVIGYMNLASGSATPDQSIAAAMSLNRLGYPVSLSADLDVGLQSAMTRYHKDFPLPVTNRQIDLIISEVASQAPLDVEGEEIKIRQTAVPALVDKQIGDMKRNGNLTRTLSPEDKELLTRSVEQGLEKFTTPVPQLKIEKRSQLQSEQSRERPVILRATPDQVSSDSFISQRMEMRAVWEAGNTAIAAAGGRIVAIDGSSAEGGKREIFTRDRFIMVGDKAYLPDINLYSQNDPEYAGYKSEIDQARTALNKQGIETIDVTGSWFEGGNIIQHDKSHTIFMGLAPDDDPKSAQLLIAKINETQDVPHTMLAVPMVEYDRMGVYHLDLALSEPLPDGKIMFDEHITDDHTRERIEQIVGKENIIPMTRDEAIQGSANILRVGHTAIMTNISDRLKAVLDQENISYISSSDFEKTGRDDIDKALSQGGLGIGNGGMHCMGQAIAVEPNPNAQLSVQPTQIFQKSPS